MVVAEGSADHRKTLAAIRSLGRAGIDVTFGSDRPRCPPGRSRYCRRRVELPSAVDDPASFAERLLGVLAEAPYDVLLPLSDHATLAVAARMDALERVVRLPIAPRVALGVAYDKLATLAAAVRTGVDVPRSWSPADPDALTDLAAELEYPCVFKLSRGTGAVGLRIARDRRELLDAARAWTPRSDSLFAGARPVVQEYVPGSVHDACLLFRRGRVRAAMTQRRLVMHPPKAGVGIRVRTTDEPELRERAIALLESLEWHGPAMVEFKRDDRDGRYRLMEINGRFWGTLDLAIQAGVDFPALACRMAVEGDVEPVVDYEVGMEYRWILPHAVLHAAESERPWRSLWAWVRPRRGLRSEIRWTDPAPHLGELSRLVSDRQEWLTSPAAAEGRG